MGRRGARRVRSGWVRSARSTYYPPYWFGLHIGYRPGQTNTSLYWHRSWSCLLVPNLVVMGPEWLAGGCRVYVCTGTDSGTFYGL